MLSLKATSQLFLLDQFQLGSIVFNCLMFNEQKLSFDESKMTAMIKEVKQIENIRKSYNRVIGKLKSNDEEYLI